MPVGRATRTARRAGEAVRHGAASGFAADGFRRRRRKCCGPAWHSGRDRARAVQVHRAFPHQHFMFGFRPRCDSEGVVSTCPRPG